MYFCAFLRCPGATGAGTAVIQSAIFGPQCRDGAPAAGLAYASGPSAPRLTQYYRFAFSHEYAPAGTETVNLGNGRGGGIIAWNRCEFDLYPPGYVQHHSASVDGFGDVGALMKLRIVSTNALHGNYIATFLLSRTSPRQ